MRFVLLLAAAFSVCLSISSANAQNKVVVVPLGSKANPAPVAKTGQTNCFDWLGEVASCTGTRQDGDLQKGVSVTSRFTDNGDGTVYDRLTGLTWLKDGNCTTFFSGDNTGVNPRTWQQALDAANQLAAPYCGLTDGSNIGDWRLPNMRELESLVDYGQSQPCYPVGTPFSSQAIGSYWASTSGESFYSTSAWVISFQFGFNLLQDKLNSSSSFFRPVRGGK